MTVISKDREVPFAVMNTIPVPYGVPVAINHLQEQIPFLLATWLVNPAS
jgi:hypothetical protein